MPLLFKQLLCQQCDGWLVPTAERHISWATTNSYCSHIKTGTKREETAPRKSIIENTVGIYSRTGKIKRQKTKCFPSLLCFLHSFFLTNRPVRLEWEEKKVMARLTIRVLLRSISGQITFMITDSGGVPLNTPTRGVWVRLSQRDNKNHCCVPFRKSFQI